MENLVINKGTPQRVEITVYSANGTQIELSKCESVQLVIWTNGRSRAPKDVSIIENIIIAELSAPELDYLGEYSAQVKFMSEGVQTITERVYLFRVANDFYKTLSGISENETFRIEISAPLVAYDKKLVADAEQATINANGQADYAKEQGDYAKEQGSTIDDKIDAKSIELLDKSVSPEKLSDSTLQLINASGGGTITNLADDEDLTTSGNVLKFKDKAYAPSNFSGLGRKILRKNINATTGKNILTQAMLSQSNTIYEIQYDYDLNGATITVPEGCTLKFDGGSLSNGVVVGNNTVIKNEGNNIIFNYLYFNSNSPTYDFNENNTFICENISLKWFGILPNISDNQQLKFEQLTTLICSCENVVLNAESGLYKFGAQDEKNQRRYHPYLSTLALFIGHALIKVTGSVIKSFIFNGNGSIYEDVYPHKTGWFNPDGTPDFAGQTDGYTKKQFAYPGTGIIIKDVSNLMYVKIDGVDINLNFRSHNYGGSIAPTLESQCIGVFLKDNIGDVYLSNCKLHGSPTDGSMIWYQNYAELNNVECYDNVRSGFSAESGNNYSLYSSRFYNNGYELPTQVSFSYERPWTNVNFEIMPTVDHTINDIIIDGCYFGDCGQDVYSLSVMMPSNANKGTFINSLHLTNSTFERTKSVKTACNINRVNNVSMSNLTYINSQFTSPNALNGATVSGIKLVAQKWDGYESGFTNAPYYLSTFNNTSKSSIDDISIYLLDYFGIGDFNDSIKTNPRIVNNITIHVLEPLHNSASGIIGIGRIPTNTNTLRIIDHVLDDNLVDKNKPIINNLTDANNIDYIKKVGSIKSIRMPLINYKTDVKIVNERHYPNRRASKLMLYNGNFSSPDEISLSCMINPTLDFETLPDKSLSYNTTYGNFCKFHVWNASLLKFDTFFGNPRRLKQLAFLNTTEFNNFISTNSITTLIKGERVMIGNSTAYATGVGVSIVDSNGFNFVESKKGTTAQRPTLLSTDAGFQFYDTTLKKYICWSGTDWTNLDGTALAITFSATTLK